MKPSCSPDLEIIDIWFHCSIFSWYWNFVLNPFVPNTPFLYPLKTSENRKVFRCFQEAEWRCIGNEWVKIWKSMKYSQRGIQDTAKLYKLERNPKTVNGFHPLNIYAKHLVLDVWEGSGFTSDSHDDLKKLRNCRKNFLFLNLKAFHCFSLETCFMKLELIYKLRRQEFRKFLFSTSKTLWGVITSLRRYWTRFLCHVTFTGDIEHLIHDLCLYHF